MATEKRKIIDNIKILGTCLTIMGIFCTIGSLSIINTVDDYWTGLMCGAGIGYSLTGITLRIISGKLSK